MTTTKEAAAPAKATKMSAAKEDPNWWDDKAELLRVQLMLNRAGILPEAEIAYYKTKPWKWSGEKKICDVIEKAMRQSHVLPEKGWEMTCGQIALVAAEAER